MSKEIPRVTEILKPYSGFIHVPYDILERAAERGTKVHAICAAIAHDAWVDDELIDESLKGYVKSFRQWAADYVQSYDIIEKRYNFASNVPQYAYTGQVDFVITGKDGKKYLVDLKTSAQAQKTYLVQMAAYRNLLNSHGIQVDACFLVYLNRDGQYPKIGMQIDTEKELHTFISALDCWYYFNYKEKNGRHQKPESDATDSRSHEGS